MFFWPSNFTYGYIFKETQNTNLKEYVHPYVHCSIIHNSQDMEAAQVPINRKVDKKDIVHIYNGILIGHKKKGNIIFWNSIDETGDYMPSELSQSEKDNTIWSHLYWI